MSVSPAVQWDWVLCRSSDMTEITELNVHQRHVEDQLNNQGKATGWVHLLDEAAAEIVPHQTALRLDRNGKPVWSGGIWQANDSSSAASGGQQSGTDRVDITAFGWFNAFGGSGENGRLVHTGQEFQDMLAGPNGIAWVAENGAYISLGEDSATQLTYSAAFNPATTDAAIIFDLVNRANVDAPTLMTPGNIYGTPYQRNLTLQRFQSVGQEIIQLVNVENGVDFFVDPVTRKIDLYGLGASTSPIIPNGRGTDRGAGMLFSYPGNCTAAGRTQDGLRTQNRIEAIGQYGVGRADDLSSQTENFLLEAQASLSEVVDPNILIAYAQAEVAIKKAPWQVVSVTPRPVILSDASVSGVPRPYDDFLIGDVVYCRVVRGRMQIGVDTPQPVRAYSWTIDIDDDGIERVSNIQTTYQSVSA